MSKDFEDRLRNIRNATEDRLTSEKQKRDVKSAAEENKLQELETVGGALKSTRISQIRTRLGCSLRPPEATKPVV